MIKNINLNNIDNIYSRENFRIIKDSTIKNPFSGGNWELLDIEFTGALTNAKVAHSLGFIPKDAFITYRSNNSATVTINYSSFTSSLLDITVSAAITIRLICGKYENNA